MNSVTLHRSAFGLIVQLLSTLERLSKIRGLGFAYSSVYLLRVQLQLREDVYWIYNARLWLVLRVPIWYVIEGWSRGCPITTIQFELLLIGQL